MELPSYDRGITVGRGRRTAPIKVLCAVVLLLVIASCGSDERQDLTYAPLSETVFIQEPVIDGWINRPSGPDAAAIDGHAWDLWAALNAPTGQVAEGTELPVWETWYTGADVFRDTKDVSQASTGLSAPAQFTHTSESAGRTTPQASVLSFNRYNRQMLDHVAQNSYFDLNNLKALRTEFDSTGAPVDDRSVAQFPNTSVMLKPVWWIVPGDRATPVPYWAGEGPEVATSLDNPDWKTWRQCVVFDPTGEATSDRERICNLGQAGESKMAPGSYAVLDLSVDSDDLYAFRLTADEVDDLGEFPLILDDTNVESNVEEVEAGDFAVLLAMHVTTREIANWTWQTFWWVPEATVMVDKPPASTAAPSFIGPPWNSFHMCSAYYMVTPPGDPNGEPHICFNPYLETNLTGLFSLDRTISNEVGINSNCMTCHQSAQVLPGKAEYAVNGLLSPDNALWFGEGVRTEFAWSMEVRAHLPPFQTPAGIEAGD